MLQEKRCIQLSTASCQQLKIQQQICTNNQQKQSSQILTTQINEEPGSKNIIKKQYDGNKKLIHIESKAQMIQVDGVIVIQDSEQIISNTTQTQNKQTQILIKSNNCPINKQQQLQQCRISTNNHQSNQYLCCLIQQKQVLKYLFTFNRQQSHTRLQQLHHQQQYTSNVQINDKLYNNQQNVNNRQQKYAIFLKLHKQVGKLQKQTHFLQQSKQEDTSDKSSLSDIKQLYQNLKQSNLMKFMEISDNQFQIYQQYRSVVQRTLINKCKQQIKCGDYPQISYTLYKRILTIWEKLQKSRKNQYVGIDSFLKFQHLQRLAPSMWLNDTIMSAYLNLIKQEIVIKKSNQSSKIRKYMLFDSLKTATVFGYQNQKDIIRILQKNQVIKYHTILILLINVQKHWLFISVQPVKRQNKQITTIRIFDSLPKKSVQQYLKIKILQKIVNFFKLYYNTVVELGVCENYPKQKNNSDCGVMALSGIKDLVRQYLFWSFNSSDMMYKRVLITKQLVDCQLNGF